MGWNQQLENDVFFGLCGFPKLCFHARRRMEEVANPMETLMSWGFEMQAFYFNAIEILGRPRRLDLERVFLVKDARCHPWLVASIDKEYVFFSFFRLLYRFFSQKPRVYLQIPMADGYFHLTKSKVKSLFVWQLSICSGFFSVGSTTPKNLPTGAASFFFETAEKG